MTNCTTYGTVTHSVQLLDLAGAASFPQFSGDVFVGEAKRRRENGVPTVYHHTSTLRTNLI